MLPQLSKSVNITCKCEVKRRLVLLLSPQKHCTLRWQKNNGCPLMVSRTQNKSHREEPILEAQIEAYKWTSTCTRGKGIAFLIWRRLTLKYSSMLEHAFIHLHLKPAKRIFGTNVAVIQWNKDGQKEEVWVMESSWCILAGIVVKELLLVNRKRPSCQIHTGTYLAPAHRRLFCPRRMLLLVDQFVFALNNKSAAPLKSLLL